MQGKMERELIKRRKTEKSLEGEKPFWGKGFHSEKKKLTTFYVRKVLLKDVKERRGGWG